MICIPAVDKINQQLTIFTADKTLHMPTDFRSSSECEDSHLSKVHGHTAFFTSCWHCKTGFYCPYKAQKIIKLHDSQVYINNKIKDSTCLTQTNLVLVLFTDIERKLHGCVETKKYLFETVWKRFHELAQPTSEIFLNTSGHAMF